MSEKKELVLNSKQIHELKWFCDKERDGPTFIQCRTIRAVYVKLDRTARALAYAEQVLQWSEDDEGNTIYDEQLKKIKDIKEGKTGE